MANKCKCGRFVGAAEGAKCKKCASLFHRGCVNSSPDIPTPSKWVCEPCQKGKVKTSKSSSTPAPPGVTIPNQSSDGVPILPAAANSSMQEDPANSIVAELRLLRSEMASFRAEISQLNYTLCEFNSRVDGIESRLSRLEEKSAFCESNENGGFQSTISQLQLQLNERDQDLLMNDVEISGLQEASGESLISISCLLAKKLGVDLEDRDVVSAERSGPRRVAPAGEGVRAPRPRAIVVRLARRALRDELLRAARVRRGADSSGITESEPRRFYVNEHLTRTNRQLFYKAREEGRNKNWKFVWTKAGRIYIRQTAAAPIHRIRTEADIEKFFAN